MRTTTSWMPQPREVSPPTSSLHLSRCGASQQCNFPSGNLFLS